MIIIHLSNPIVFLESFRHALEMMRHSGYACTRTAATGIRRWACFAASL